MSELKWCEECKSMHTEEFGQEFHGRILREPIGGCCPDFPQCHHRAGQEMEYARMNSESYEAKALVKGWSCTGCILNNGDIVTIEGMYQRWPWWHFWRWFMTPKLQQFVIRQE